MVVVVVAVAVWLIRLLFDGVSILPCHPHEDNGTSVCLHPGDRTRTFHRPLEMVAQGRGSLHVSVVVSNIFWYFLRKIGEDE